MLRSRQRLPSIGDLLDGMAVDIELSTGINAGAGVAASDVQAATDLPLWEPLPGPQRMAYDSAADELFYGGAAGGGKSDLILGLAVMRHRSSIIFRREFTQFTGTEGLIARSAEVIGLRGHFARGKVWEDMPGDRSLEFGAVQHEKHVNRYKGRPHDFIAFDEIPDFTEAQYRFLGGWLRTKHEGQRTRVVVTGNPPTSAEGQWVIKYWGPWLDPTHPNPAKPGELRWFTTVEGKDVELASGKQLMVAGPGGQPQLVQPRSRTFIPAKVEDNPYYMRTGYVDVLNNLPEPWRSQLRFGNFQAAVSDADWQLIPMDWIVAAQARWRPDGGKGYALTQAGNDPSRGGKDEFVVTLRYGPWVAPLITYPATKAPTGQAGAALVYRAVADNDVPVQIDIGGQAGSSVYDQCVDLKMKAVAVNGSEKSVAKDKAGKLPFYNVRAELHWRFRELLDPTSGNDMALPPDPQMRSDLAAMRWEVTPRGIKIEDKEEIKKRIGRSPDRGEATIYGCVPLSAAAKKEYRATW